jgi:uncharacterized protein
MSAIPDFPDFRAVELEDRDAVEALFRGMSPEVSELNFTNLFMFKHVHNYRLSVLNRNLIILAKSYTDEPYFMPPVGDTDIHATIAAMMDYMKNAGGRPVIELAWEDFVGRHIAPEPSFGYEIDHNSSDYVYNTRELIELAGRRFHDKKNFRNRFEREYAGRYEYRPLTPDLIEGAVDLTNRWCKEKCTLDSPSTFGETEATMCALRNLGNLSTRGSVVLMDGRVEALSLGEELNPDMVVVHVEKANADFSGLYQYISSEFLAREFPDYTFTNREQDLGEPNLRKSKQSYNPVRMVYKYRVWVK